MLVVPQPLDVAWPQESPRLAPWVPYVSAAQSLCGCFGASALHPHPWCHLLVPSIYDEKNVRPSWSYICIHMTGCHYVSSHKNMSFESIYKKTQKNLIIQKLKKRFGIRYQCHRMLIPVVEACRDLPKNLSPHRGNHRWQLSTATTMEINQLGRGWIPYLRPVYA